MPKRWRRIGSGCAGLALLATAASAEDMPSAVGRISYSDVPQPGAAICSGVLVASGLVLTAGHCVRGAAADPAGLRFDAGWTDGHPGGRRRGRAVILAAAEVPPGLAGLAQDVALVVLDRAFLPAEATPLPLAAAAPGVFVLHAFARTPPEAAPKQPATDHPAPALSCAALATRPGLLGLDCPVVSGNSGAPLLQRGGDGWQIVAIMVASGKGPAQAWAARIPAVLLAEIQQRAE